jgi:hypothetical protein
MSNVTLFTKTLTGPRIGPSQEIVAQLPATPFSKLETHAFLKHYCDLKEKDSALFNFLRKWKRYYSELKEFMKKDNNSSIRVDNLIINIEDLLKYQANCRPLTQAIKRIKSGKITADNMRFWIFDWAFVWVSYDRFGIAGFEMNLAKRCENEEISEDEILFKGIWKLEKPAIDLETFLRMVDDRENDKGEASAFIDSMLSENESIAVFDKKSMKKD